MHKIANHSQYWYARWGEARVLIALTCSCGYEACGDDYDPTTAYRQALEHFSDHIALVARNRRLPTKHKREVDNEAQKRS